MGLSRNKVAVPEGAAGTPPFWSDAVSVTTVTVTYRLYRFCFLYYWYLFIYRYRSTIYSIIDRDKQEKQEAESRRKVDKVELVL